MKTIDTNYFTGANTSSLYTKGETTATGNGSTTAFTIAHGLGSNPSAISVEPMTTASAPTAATVVYTHDSTNITVTYGTAPANAASLKWSWVAFK